MVTKVFISAGTPADDSQKAFRDTIVNAIQIAGLAPCLMTPQDWDYKNPLRGVRRVMEECFGAVVIAYPRYHFPTGIELRKDGVRPLQEVSFPTPWNQIEAALAYERGIPLLIVAQTGLRQDAFLESTQDVRPLWVNADSGISSSEGFLGYLRSWKQDVEEYAAKKGSQTPKLSQDVTIKLLFSSLPWYEAVALVVTIVGILVAAATIGYRFGSGQWPFG